jgi:hypothetical protein
LACQDKFFLNKSLDVICLAFFSLSEFGPFHWVDCYFVSGS